MTTEKIVLKAEKSDCLEACATCSVFKADNLKHAIARLDGVSNPTVKVNEITGKVTLEYDPQKISLTKITERMKKLGYQVEIISQEEIK
jgi:copper chaperone CopZ